MSTETAENLMIRQAFDHSVKNLEFHISCSESLSRDSTTSMNVVGSASLGALGYTAHLLEKDSQIPVIIGLAAISLHLLVVTWLILNKCLQASEICPAWNTSDHMHHPGYSAEDVLLAEIKGHPAREQMLRERNNYVGYWLNRLRKWAFAAPFTFLTAWAVAAWVSA